MLDCLDDFAFFNATCTVSYPQIWISSSVISLDQVFPLVLGLFDSFSLWLLEVALQLKHVADAILFNQCERAGILRNAAVSNKHRLSLGMRALYFGDPRLPVWGSLGPLRNLVCGLLDNAFTRQNSRVLCWKNKVPCPKNIV